MMFFIARTVPEGRLFGLDFQTFISVLLQLLNGIILAVGLGYILYNPVKEFMRKRAEDIQNKLDKSEQTMDKANRLIQEYEAKIRDIEQERMEILEAARHKAADEAKTIIEEAKKEAQELKKRSLESIEDDKKRLFEETRIHIIELSSLLAGKYIAQNIDQDTHTKLFEEALEKMESAQWQN